MPRPSRSVQPAGQDRARPTAKQLLDGILQAMYDAQEPLDDDLVLVASDYDVFLHPDAYQQLRPLMPRIREQAQLRLDEALTHLNSRPAGGLARLFRRMGAALLRLFFADPYLRRSVASGATYERAGRAWRINFSVTPDPAAGLDYLMVEADFGVQVQAAYKGRPTLNIRRHTILLPNGRFETVLTARRPTVPTPEVEPAAAPMGAPVTALARLRFEDDQGWQVYYMTKEQIIIGRRDDPAHFLDVALETRPDVSREHVRIRYDPAAGRFAIKDVSRYGTTLDGAPVASSLNEHEEDINLWHPLPGQAEVGLAGVLFIHFEALAP